MTTEKTEVTCKCVACTYIEPIKMKLASDGFHTARCPRCGTEYLKYVKVKEETK